MDLPLFSINTGSHCFDAQFHPSRPLLAAATVTGEIELHSFELESGEQRPADAELVTTEVVRKLASHKESCRSARFLSAERLASCSASQFTAVSDMETGTKIWRAKLRAAGNALLPLPHEGQFLVGDDDGCIALFDIRQKKPSRRFCENSDYISDMALGADGFSLCASSGDGTLAVYDIRKKSEKALTAMSDFQEDEFLSLAIVKDGKKVICGSQMGIVAIFSWGDFGDQKDRVKGHPLSIDAMAKLSEDAVLTGSSDGKIRVVSIYNKKYGNCIVGRLGEHGPYPLEHLAVSTDRGMIVSASHEQPAIKVWSMARAQKILSDFEQRGEDTEDVQAPAVAEEKEVDSDSSDEPVSNKKKKRTKGMPKRQAAKAAKSATSFFDDL